jgi:hypothetical protein
LRSHDVDLVSRAILTISWHDKWGSAQEVCLEFARSEKYWIRRNAVAGLGHIARIHGAIDVGSILELFGDLVRSGVPEHEFEDMFNDIMIFVARQGRRNI